MTYARRPARRAALRSSRRVNTLSRDRRGLFAEQLEARTLMAADWQLSEGWNGTRPTDVNADGATAPLDALLVINELNNFGSHAVVGPSAKAAGGEGENPTSGLNSRMYQDVNNDGVISPLDALLVINELNGEGEATLMRYQISLFQPGTNTPLPMVGGVPTITKGTDYDLVVTVKDDRAGGRGVFAGYLDVDYNSSLTRPKVSEIQHIVLDPSTTSGTFRLTFNGQQTADITFSDLTNPNTIASQIQTALAGLSTIGSSGGVPNVEVTFDPIAASGGQPAVPLRWQVRFRGTLLDQNVNPITIAPGSVNPIPASSLSVVQTAQGVVTDPIAFREAFRSRVIPGVNDVVYYVNALNAGNLPNKIDDVGAIATGSTPFPFTFPAELVRARMTATDAGSIVFAPDLSDIVKPAHDSLLYDRNTALATMEINAGTSVTLNITETISATDDTVNITEGSTGITFDPRVAGGNPTPANPTQPGILADVNSTGSGTLQVRSVGTAAHGTVTLGTGANLNRITYVPQADFFGSDTFTYTIGIGASGGATDSGTVTVNVAGVNDAPTITVQGGTSKSTPEDTALVFSPGNSNAITVADIDGGTASEQVTLTATNGTLTLGSTTNLTVTGNGTATVMLTGPLADLNNGLNGLTFNPTPDFPTSGASGNASIAINVNDLGNTGTGGALQANATVTVTVNAVNDAPVNTVPASANVDEGSILTFSPVISVNDVDAGNANIVVTLSVTAGTGVLNVTAANPPTITGNGTATLTMTGSQSAINARLATLTFTPANGFLGTTTLTVNTNDQGSTGTGGAKSDIDTIPISVDPTVRPRARADSFTLPEVSPTPVTATYTMNVLQNDVGNVGFFPTLEQIISQPATGGTVAIVDAGVVGDHTDDVIVFTANDPNFFGQVTFQYGIWDTSANPKPAPLPANAIATVTLTITNTNDNPVAVDDPVSTNEDTPIDIPVLSNDSDPDNNFGSIVDTLTPVIVTNPSHGTVTVNANKTVHYAPALNFNGSDSFTYQVNDGKGGLSNVATVSITVNPVDDSPVAVNDSYQPTEDTPLTVTAANGVLFNDTDVDTAKSSLTAIKVTDPTHGTVALAADGSFVYTPTQQDFAGTDSFTYKVNDGNSDSNVATVTLTYIPVNDPPVAVDDLNYTMTEDTLLTVNAASGILANDTDVDTAHSALTVMLPVTFIPPNDTLAAGLTVNPNGSFSYTPPSNFTGVFEFQYRASDALSLSNVATVRITVVEFDDPPVTSSFTASTNEDTSVDIDALPHVADPDSPNITLVQPGTNGTTGPSHGTVTIVGNQYHYTPASNFFGTDSFQYRVSDQVGQPLRSNVSTITVTVKEVNDAPIANDDGTPVAILAVKDFVDQPISVLGNDTDPDNTDGITGNEDVLRVFQVNGGTGPVATLHGSVRVSGSGTSAQILYTPNAGYTGPDSFTYTISDGRTTQQGTGGPLPGISNSATVTLEVVDFVPKDVGGVVFVDGNANGEFDFADLNGNGEFDPGEPSERTIMGITVHLQGTSFRNDTPVSVDAVTDIDGRYTFAGLEPPKQGTSYTMTEIQPLYLIDGPDSPRDAQDSVSNPASALISDNGNDSFKLAWAITDQSGPITARFGERGIDAAAVNAGGGNSGGLVTDILASSSNNGFVLTTDAAGNFIWSWTLPGWENAKTLTIHLDANLASATLTGTDRDGNPFSIRIHQDPTLNTEANYPAGSTNPYGPRFRILGRSGTNDYLIRIDGTAAQFGLDLLAAADSSGEGEGEGNVDRDFARAADEVFSGEAWA